MTKKKVMIISGIIIVLLIAGGIFFYVKKNREARSASVVVAPTPNTTAELAIWTDPAGFTFQYPKGIEIDKHDEDQENYAHLEFSSPNNIGTLFIWAKDTTYPTMDAWMKADKTLKSATSVDTTLGTIEGKKIIVETNGVKKIITGVITDEIIFTVEMEKGTDVFWDEAYNTIVSSFAFDGEKDTSGDTSQTSGDEEMSVDEEETLE